VLCYHKTLEQSSTFIAVECADLSATLLMNRRAGMIRKAAPGRPPLQSGASARGGGGCVWGTSLVPWFAAGLPVRVIHKSLLRGFDPALDLRRRCLHHLAGWWQRPATAPHHPPKRMQMKETPVLTMNRSRQFTWAATGFMASMPEFEIAESAPTSLEDQS
jgi:hypothetical protein